MQFDKDSRTIYISEEINSSLGQVNFELIKWISEDDEKSRTLKNFKREPIKMYIQSHGGTICDMWSLIDIILNSKTPIHTYCTGYASSAAFKIFWLVEKDTLVNTQCFYIIKCHTQSEELTKMCKNYLVIASLKINE